MRRLRRIAVFPEWFAITYVIYHGSSIGAPDRSRRGHGTPLPSAPGVRARRRSLVDVSTCSRARQINPWLKCEQAPAGRRVETLARPFFVPRSRPRATSDRTATVVFGYIRYFSNRRLPAGRGQTVSTIPAGSSATAIPLTLRPLSANVSFRDQAYAALKQAIMDADIYSHPRGDAARRAATGAVARRVAGRRSARR